MPLVAGPFHWCSDPCVGACADPSLELPPCPPLGVHPRDTSLIIQVLDFGILWVNFCRVFSGEYRE